MASPVWEQVTGPDAHRRKTGSLLKWVNYVAGWQKRYFELQNGLLSYYRSADEVGAGCRGSMLAQEISIEHRGKEMILTAGNATFYLRAQSEQDLMRWITALELEKQHGPPEAGTDASHPISGRLSEPAASGGSEVSPPSWTVNVRKQSGLSRRDSFGSMASTFSEASDFSEPSYAPEERSAGMLKQLGPLSGALLAQERGIRKLNQSGEAFAAACAKYEGRLNATLVGPEPDIEARQEEYIDQVRQSHRKVCEMLSKVIVGAIDHHKELLKAASYSQEQVNAAQKRVEEMEVDVDKVRRVLKQAPRVLKQAPRALPRSSSSDTIVEPTEATTDKISEVRTPDRQPTSWELGPVDSPTTLQTKRFAALSAVLTPSRLPNRPPSTRHRRCSSDPKHDASAVANIASAAVSAIDIKLATSEKSPTNAAEKFAWDQVARRVGGAADLGCLSERDKLQIVRGFATAKDPIGEAVESATRIARWRVSVNFENLVQRSIPVAERFHRLWQETVYGEDCFGHPLVSITVADIDVGGLVELLLGAIPAHVHSMVQRLAAYRDYLEYISAVRSEQRYKMSFLIDMSGAGVSSLLGENKALMQKIFGVGSQYFPETVWKIYVVNAPFALRMGWAIVSKLIHPVTEAKIAILGSYSETQARLRRDGFALDAIPSNVGGSNQGLPCWDLLLQLQKTAP